MPPADSTEGCAAHGPISTARKGVVRKARSLSTRLGPARPLGTRQGEISESLVVYRPFRRCEGEKVGNRTSSGANSGHEEILFSRQMEGVD